MRDTSILEKLVPTIINSLFAFIISIPFYILFGFGVKWKVSVISIFYIIQILSAHRFFSFRCLGMYLFGTVWEKNYSRLQRNIYSLLYTCSFATLLFYIYFPFDLFILNIFLFQLPTILLKGTTFHGFLAGGMKTKMPNKI